MFGLIPVIALIDGMKFHTYRIGRENLQKCYTFVRILFYFIPDSEFHEHRQTGRQLHSQSKSLVLQLVMLQLHYKFHESPT